MKKIPSVFKRNYETDRLIRDEVVEGCEWVLAGEGVATRKWDGTPCLIQDGRMYKRFDCKEGRTPPVDWFPCEAAPDPNTGHWPGWVPIGDSKEDRLFHEAYSYFTAVVPLANGTYELIGPRVNKNADGFDCHRFVVHGGAYLNGCPRDFEGIKEFLAKEEIEGIVFHHPDGRMAKVKARDFGLPWPIKGGNNG